MLRIEKVKYLNEYKLRKARGRARRPQDRNDLNL